MYKVKKVIPIQNVSDMHASPKKDWLACNTLDRTVEVLHITDGDYVRTKTLSLPSATAQGKNGIRFSADGKYLAVCDQQNLSLFSVPEFELLSSVVIGSDIAADFTRGHGLCFHPRSKVIAVTGKSWIGTFRYTNDKLEFTGATTGHAGFYTPTFNPDGSVLVVECSANHAVFYSFNEDSDGVTSLQNVSIANPFDNLFIDNRVFVTSTNDNGSVVLGTAGTSWGVTQTLNMKAATFIRYDGKRIAVTTANSVEILDQWSLDKLESIETPANSVMTFI